MNDTIRLARALASKRFPYLSTAIFSMQLVEIDKFETMAVDNKWRCYYNRDTVEKWGKEITETVLVHEVWHLLRKHHERIGSRDPEEWNRATDREINDDLRSLKFPFEVHLPEHIKMAPGLTAEKYYQESEAGKSGGSQSGGSCADGIPRPWEHGDSKTEPGQEGLSKTESELIIRDTARQLKEHYGKFPGSVPYGARVWADFVLGDSKVDYRKELRSRLSSIIKRGFDDTTYAKVNRRRFGHEIVFPGPYAIEPQIAVILDTSGSMNQEGNKVLSEVNAILKKFENIRIISADCAIHKIQNVRNIKDICAIGGGGTSMKMAIEKVDKMKPDVILTITDGYTDWNSKPTRAKQITLLTHNVNKPPFGKTILV